MLDPAILSRATALLKQRKTSLSLERERRRAALYEDYPPLRTLEAELRSLLLVGMMELSDTAIRDAQEKSRAITGRIDSFMLEYGLDPELLSDTPHCAKCGDSGYIGSRLCGCLKKLYTQVQLTELKKSLPYPDASFDAFDPGIFSDESDAGRGLSPRENMEGMYDLCADYAQSFSGKSGNLFFNGFTGTGKTFLSSCIAEAVAQRGFNVIYETAIRCFAVYEAEKFDRAEPGGIKKIMTADLLVLDDLGTELITNMVQSSFYDILNTRLTHSRPMIINSNLTIDDLRNRYLPQSVSRLEGDFEKLFFFGEDLRKRRNGRS